MALLDSLKHTFMPEKITNLNELFLEQLQDLYSAENQLIDALPKMEKAAYAKPLKAGFKAHLQQTKEHAKRLERIFKKLKADRPRDIAHYASEFDRAGGTHGYNPHTRADHETSCEDAPAHSDPY